MAARKKVTKTAKSGETAAAIRSKPDVGRAKIAGSKAVRSAAPKPVGVTHTATKPDKAGAKPEKAATKPAPNVAGAAPRKAEVVAVKPEARAHVHPVGAPGPQAGKARTERVDVKAGEALAETTKATTGVSAPAFASAAALPLAPAAAAKTAKPAPAPKTNEREPSGGDQKTMKNSVNRHGFKLNEFVVYPAHGVGQIVSIEEQEVAGFKLELFVINFAKDKMTLRVPVGKVTGVGMRKLSDPDQARRSLEILTGRARVKRTMWSRRAQEYEAKINSGDINAIAEVVRDLFRSEAQPEQSYSERQLYEAALDRMMREIAAVQKTSEAEAFKVIDTQLKKNTKRGAKADPSDPADADEAGIEEAA